MSDRGETFGVWLRVQIQRERLIRLLIADMKADRRFRRDGSPDDVRKQLNAMQADGDLFEAVDEMEYRRDGVLKERHPRAQAFGLPSFLGFCCAARTVEDGSRIAQAGCVDQVEPRASIGECLNRIARASAQMDGWLSDRSPPPATTGGLQSRVPNRP